MGASQEQFRIPLCGRGEEARHSGLVFDKFLNHIIHRGRVEVVLRAGLVGGELVNNYLPGGLVEWALFDYPPPRLGKVLKLCIVPNRNLSLEAVLSEGDLHCRAGDSTPVDNPATRVVGRARRVASRLTPCGWRERPPSSRSAMARTKW